MGDISIGQLSDKCKSPLDIKIPDSTSGVSDRVSVVCIESYMAPVALIYKN